MHKIYYSLGTETDLEMHKTVKSAKIRGELGFMMLLTERCINIQSRTERR